MDVLEMIEKAIVFVTELCHGERRWTMSIPARPDDDPDIVISRALHESSTAIAALREENARKDEALTDCIAWMVAYGCSHEYAVLKKARAALASARPAPAQEQGKEAVGKLIGFAERHDGVAVTILFDRKPDMDITTGQAYAMRRALLARKPAEEVDRSLDQFQGVPRVGKPAEERGAEVGE